MESSICMNDLCGASITAAGDCKKGWPLRSGDSAKLCGKCGIAYEQLAFCELFHVADSGWRECNSCGKRLHCGCIASSAFIELLENGGVSCLNCSNTTRRDPSTSEDKPEECGVSVENSVGEIRSSSIKMLKQNDNNDDASTSQMKHEEIQTFNGTSETALGTKLVETDLTIGLASSSSSSQKPVFVPNSVIEERELNKTYSSNFQQQQGASWSRHILPKLPKSIAPHGFDPNFTSSQIRVARPPVEGRIKNQLLPRYWPRITEQELQQISGDSNATVVPLFEKVLSASDAGRIGRLVLPKACAEAYFPPISQPEGLPIRIQDVKGKEWLFQFRFWPNNNSRMYVLEGVTPCIQSMQLKAGDTVTFSRLEPEGKLLMGFRKAAVTSVQDSRIAAMHNGVFPSEHGVNNTMENVPNMSSDYSGLLQSMKRNSDSNLNNAASVSRNMNLPIGDAIASWHHNANGSKSRGDSSSSLQQPDKKRSRNLNSKSKRLLIESQDALELKYTWEELQDMLTPPTTIIPTTLTIEDNEFEEYEEPPVFGKGSIFTVRSSGEQDQWVECDNCSKWRRLPVDFLLPAKWTCQENVWEQPRSNCLAPNELNPRELDNLLGQAKEFHKWRSSVSHNNKPDGDNEVEPPIATTTKHPRHRPGCSCIVCSQPPSGKGKHKPNCTCNVCMTVKRRFKTLMLRKQQRQSEREAGKNHLKFPETQAQTQTQTQRQVVAVESSGKGQLDLNIQYPIHHHQVEDNNNNNKGTTTHLSMMSLLQAANQPLEIYMKENGLTSLISEQEASSGCTPTIQQDEEKVNEEDTREPDNNNNENSS